MMSNKTYSFSVLTVGSTNWSTRVLLIEKTCRRKVKTLGHEWQCYIFIDDLGTKIQTICYTPDTIIVYRVLQLFKTYVISNAKLTICSIQFHLVDNELQWLLTASTVMEEDTENALDLSLNFPIFTSFTELGKYIETSTNLDIIGIVIDKSVAKKVNTQQGPTTVQDLVLISQEKISVILSL